MKMQVFVALILAVMFAVVMASSAGASSFGIITGNKCEVCNTEPPAPGDDGEYCWMICPSDCQWQKSGSQEACSGEEWESCCYCGSLCDSGGKYEGQCTDFKCLRIDSYFPKGTSWDCDNIIHCCSDSDCEECMECNDIHECVPVEDGELCNSGNGVCQNGACMPDNDPPSVSIKLDNRNPSWNPETWTNQDVFPVIQCNDGEGTGCVSYSEDSNFKDIAFTEIYPSSCENQNYYIIESLAHFTGHGWVCARKKDHAGNIGFSQPVEVKIDKEKPVVNNPHPYQHEDEWVTTTQYISGSDFNVVDYPLDYPSGFRCGCYCEGEGCSPSKCTDYGCKYFSQGSSIKLDHEMNTVINWKIYDYAGNSVSGYFTAKLDFSPPVTTNSYDGKVHGNGYVLNLICTDMLENGQEGSGCKKTYYCIYDENSQPCEPNIEGNKVTLYCDADECRKVVRYYSEDNTGHREETKSSEVITLSTEVPSCEMQELPEYSGDQITLSWSGTDPFGSGIKSYNISYRKGEGEWKLWRSFASSQTSAVFTASEGDGKYSFECTATNNDGIEGSVSTPVNTIVDTEAPVTYLHSPRFWNASPFIVSWRAEDEFCESFSYDVQWSPDGNSWNFWLQSTRIQNSSFGDNGVPATLHHNERIYIRARARDEAGNTGEWSEENVITIDNEPPSCIMENLPEIMNSSLINIQWDGEDDVSGISYSNVQYRERGGEWDYVLGTRNIRENNYTFSGQNNRTYEFRCRSVDNAGNIGEWSPVVRTTVDISGPEPQSMEFEGNLTYSKNLTVSTTLYDENGIESAVIIYNGEEIMPSSVNNISENEWEVTWSFLPVQTYGDYNFEIMTKDMLGNILLESYSFSVHECVPGDERVCRNDTGQCRKGVSTCEYNGTWGPCSGGIGPSEEVCDGKDNDCDGKTDEGIECKCLPGETQECGTDVGICKKGTKTCNSNGEWGPCVGGVEPQPETCNGLDDDCNGVADDAPYPGCCSPTDPPQPYGTSNIGICRFGEKRCIAGVWQVTKEPVYPTKEVCDNGLDDDCDGYADKDDSDCVSVSLCDNGIRDEGEEGIDCGGVCSRPCINWTPFIFIVVGALILIVLVVAYFYFKSKGQELTWEIVRKKWTEA